jgi:trigger factor
VIKEKKIEHLEKSAVKLTVTVDEAEVKKQYQDLLTSYSKTAQIKGFRKGHVPAAVLERKFGESIRQEAAHKLLEDSLKTVFDEVEEKPLAYSTPTLEDASELDPESEFSYTVSYDVYPEIALPEYKGREIAVPQVKITEEDEGRELKNLQDQNAVVMEKDEGAVEAGDVVTVDYAELDEAGNEISDTKREDFVFTQGSGYNLYKIDDEVLGMEKGATKELEKTYPEEFEDKDLAGSTKKLRVTVKGIKERQLPDIDDDLAMDISEKYESLADLKADIRTRLESALEDRLRSVKTNALLEQIVDGATIEVPESMVAAELENSWMSFVQQFRATEEQVQALLQAQGRTKEQLLEEWRPNAERRLKGQLAVQKMLEDEAVAVGEEEVEAEIQHQADANNVDLEQARNYFGQPEMRRHLEREIKERKLFDTLFEESKIKKGKKMSFLDLMQSNQ